MTLSYQKYRPNEIFAQSYFHINLQDLICISDLNPSNAKATFVAKGCKDSKPFHVGIYQIALTEHSQMSTHVPGFQSF